MFCTILMPQRYCRLRSPAGQQEVLHVAVTAGTACALGLQLAVNWLDHVTSAYASPVVTTCQEMLGLTMFILTLCHLTHRLIGREMLTVACSLPAGFQALAGDLLYPTAAALNQP